MALSDRPLAAVLTRIGGQWPKPLKPKNQTAWLGARLLKVTQPDGQVFRVRMTDNGGVRQ